MNSQFKRGILELCVLKLISRKDMYAFEIIETISKDIDVNENTIYPILRRLTKEDYFSTYQENVGLGAPRKYYKLTNEGLAKLEETEKSWNNFLKGVFNIMGGIEK